MNINYRPGTVLFDQGKEIMRIDGMQRTYHFQKMAEEFARQLSEDHISVNRGRITSLSFDENVVRLNKYFEVVDFVKWDDLAPPQIRFSDDLSLAYTIVDKEVVVTYQDDSGEELTELTHFAWVAIYRRSGDTWTIECVASTNEEREVL